MNDETQINLDNVKSNDIKSIIIGNKKSIIILILFVLISFFAYFFYSDYKYEIKFQNSEKYNLAIKWN